MFLENSDSEMERDFLGLNLKDSVIVVKEEAVEGFKDSGKILTLFSFPFFFVFWSFVAKQNYV